MIKKFQRQRILIALLAFVLMIPLVTWRTSPSAAAPPPSTRTITEWTIPGCVNTTVVDPDTGDIFIIPGCEPLHPIMLSQRDIFFTERRANKIGAIDVIKNVLTEWPLPSIPNPITIPPLRPPLTASPHGIVNYGDGVMFCETGTSKIGLLDPKTNLLTEWDIPFFIFDPPGPPLPRPFSSNPLHPDKHGKLVYFSVNRSDRIAALDPKKNELTEWPLPTTQTGINGVATHGNQVFFAETTEKIGMLDPVANTITEWTLAPGSVPQHVRMAGRYVFFVESGGNRIGRLDPDTNILTEWTIPTPASNPVDLDVTGPNRIIFTESEGNKIAELDISEECGVSRVVPPVITPAPPIRTNVAATTILLTPTVTPVPPVTTTVPGVKSCGFTEWLVPTPGSRPVGIRNFRGTGGAFCESLANKVGIIR